MPSLQLHQLRVAAVAKMICDNFNPPAGRAINTNDVLLAALFHDMGNIIKSDLTTFPDFVAPEGLEHWSAIRESFIERYGPDTHKANVVIARELGLPEPAVSLIDGIGFSRVSAIVSGNSFEQKIVEYSDMRVGPLGVLSLDERLLEGRARFIARGVSGKREHYVGDGFEKLFKAAHALEKQIFELTNIAPGVITDSAAVPLIDELRKYPVA